MGKFSAKSRSHLGGEGRLIWVFEGVIDRWITRTKIYESNKRLSRLLLVNPHWGYLALNSSNHASSSLSLYSDFTLSLFTQSVTDINGSSTRKAILLFITRSSALLVRVLN